MRKMIKICDGCEKDLSKEKVYFRLDLNFRSYFQDPTVNYMEEEITNMARDTQAIYCEKCFQKFVDHMDNFILEVSPNAVKKKPRKVEMDENVAKIHSDLPDLGKIDAKKVK